MKTLVDIKSNESYPFTLEKESLHNEAFLPFTKFRLYQWINQSCHCNLEVNITWLQAKTNYF